MKATLLCVLLCLLSSLVEVQSQTEYPYISFMGNNLSNHSYVDLDEVGADRDTNTVQCHTDLSTCCRSLDGPHRGNWFAPGNDTGLPFSDVGTDIYTSIRSQVVHIHRRNNPTGPSGIYRCVIPTNAVHDNSDHSAGDTVYVGLYYGGEGGKCRLILCNNTNYV